MGTLLTHGKIYSERGVFAQAVFYEDGIIKAVGDTAELLERIPKDTDIIDLKGKTVVPGFNDSHLHLYMTAELMAMADFSQVRSLSQLIALGKDYLNQEAVEFLNGWGYNQDYFTDEKRLPQAQDLDQIATDIPIHLARACLHVSSVNSKVLTMMGISKDHIPEVEGGSIDLDEEGNPTGVFRESARELIKEFFQKNTTEEKVVSLLEMVALEANANGITSVQTNDLKLGDRFSDVIEAGYLAYAGNQPTLRINHQIGAASPATLRQRLAEGYDRSGNSAFVRYGPLKLFIDGSLGARTALMRQPYHDDPSTSGIAIYTQKQFNETVRIADEHGLQVVVHGIGDGGITMILDGFETVINKENPHRHGVIHVQITDEPLLQRFKAMDVLALVQPIFLHYDLHVVADRVGETLAATSYAWKSLEDLNLHVAYGSDAPVERFNVIHGIHCAVNRQDLQGFPLEGFHPQQRVDVYTAIDNYTLGGAYASFEENRKGRIKTGHVADFVVLSEDIFTIDPQKILSIEVEATFVDGKIAYQRKQAGLSIKGRTGAGEM